MAYSRLSTYDSRNNRSSVVTSLAFRRGGTVAPETRDGACIYFGDASQYHEWEFKTKLKLTSCTKEQFPRAMAQVIGGLRGDALAVAMNIGMDRLTKVPTSLPDKFHSSKQSEAEEDSQADGADDSQTGSQGAAASMRPSTLPPTGFLTDPTDDEDGMTALFKEIKKMVFPQTTHESRDLYKEYTKPGHGVFTRQAGEAMHLFVARRKQAWRRIRELDDKVMLSAEMRADMLLEAANIFKGPAADGTFQYR